MSFHFLNYSCSGMTDFVNYEIDSSMNILPFSVIILIIVEGYNGRKGFYSTISIDAA